MSQLNEGWASRTQEERDEMTDKEDEQKIIGLVKKYGRGKVDKATAEAKRDRKRRLSNRKITWREIKNRIDNAKDRLKPGEVKTWDKKNNRWVSNKEDVDEAVATAVATSPLWGPKALGAAMTGVGLIGTYLQSKKKKAEKEDLLGAIRKKQAEIQQDVANQETLEKNKDFQKKEKSRGKYLPRMREPENKFVKEAAVALSTSPLWLPKVLPAAAALTGAAGTIMQTKKWKELTGPKRGRPVNLNPAPSNNPDTIRMRKKRAEEKAKKEDVRKKSNKEHLKKTIEDLYGPIPEQSNWREELKC